MTNDRPSQNQRKLRPLHWVFIALAGLLAAFGIFLLFLYGYLPINTEPAAACLSLQSINAQGKLVLVNEQNPVPEEYEPADLVNMAQNRPKNTLGLKTVDMLADREAFTALCALATDVKQQGLDGLTCIAAYRTHEYQQKLFEETFNGRDIFGKVYVQKPTFSEHRTGLAFDMSVMDEDGNTIKFSETEHCTYMMAHMAEYGFILRYPEDKVEITGIGYEPWHIRYVGVEAAKEITEQGLCLEEYIKTMP